MQINNILWENVNFVWLFDENQLIYSLLDSDGDSTGSGFSVSYFGSSFTGNKGTAMRAGSSKPVKYRTIKINTFQTPHPK
jgi:hypothetical protein